MAQAGRPAGMAARWPRLWATSGGHAATFWLPLSDLGAQWFSLDPFFIYQ
jgi:hypothetical protein